MDNKLEQSNSLDALAEEVSHGCLSSRELPVKQNRRAFWVWGSFAGHCLLIALLLGIPVCILIENEISVNHLLACAFVALMAGACIFGALACWTKPRLLRFRPLFIGLFMSHLLCMAAVWFFGLTFCTNP